ncbi:hypothetical protein P7K49_025059, partial [Saguinus oedipus]
RDLEGVETLEPARFARLELSAPLTESTSTGLPGSEAAWSLQPGEHAGFDRISRAV